jgi:hypothetical protein
LIRFAMHLPWQRNEAVLPVDLWSNVRLQNKLKNSHANKQQPLGSKEMPLLITN